MVDYIGINEMLSLIRHYGEDSVLFVDKMYLDSLGVKHYDISYLSEGKELIIESIHINYNHNDKDLFSEIVLDEEGK